MTTMLSMRIKSEMAAIELSLSLPGYVEDDERAEMEARLQELRWHELRLADPRAYEALCSEI